MVSSITHSYLHESSKLTRHVCCYSDNYGRDNRIGSAFSVNSYPFSYLSSKLLVHHHCRITSSLYYLLQILYLSLTPITRIYFILSDSLSSIIAISKRYSIQVFIQRIQLTCHTALQSSERKLSLGIWMPRWDLMNYSKYSQLVEKLLKLVNTRTFSFIFSPFTE